MILVFHGTNKARAESIRREGLRACGPAMENHNGMPNDRGAYVNVAPAVGHWGTYGSARSGTEEESCVVVADIEGLFFHTDRIIGCRTSSALVVPCGVPADRILGIFDTDDEANEFALNHQSGWSPEHTSIHAELFIGPPPDEFA